MKKISLIVIISFLSFAVFFGCKTLKQIADAVTNLQRLEFKLDGVSDFRLAGINLDKKKNISDFSITDGLGLTKSFTSKKLPADFMLNVAAKNPNTGGKNTKSTPATVTGFDWKLYIDEVETVHGDIGREFVIPGTGQKEIIPLSVGLDLFQFFGNKGYDGIVNLALALGGIDGSAARLKLDAKPTVKTSLGMISYPGRLTIVDKNFTN